LFFLGRKYIAESKLIAQKKRKNILPIISVRNEKGEYFKKMVTNIINETIEAEPRRMCHLLDLLKRTMRLEEITTNKEISNIAWNNISRLNC